MFSSRRELCLLFAASSLLLLVSGCVEQEGFKHPNQTNCVHVETPSYTVVHTEEEFEIRRYKKALWVSSKKIKAKSYMEGGRKGFETLFGYYKGHNKRNMKMNMTAPVLVDIEKSRYYTTYFYVPKKYQNGKLPAPLTGDVKQVKLPRKKYAAVRNLGCQAYGTDDIVKEVAALKKSLQGTPYERAAAVSTVTFVSCESQVAFIERALEIWLWFN